MPQIEPQAETLARVELQPPIIAEGTPTLGPRPARHALPARVAIVGNYLPRQCGIATFTTDLCDALSVEYPTTHLFAVPVNDTETGYNYPARVHFELSEGDASSYRKAATFLNGSTIDVVCLQHEFGIFGGPAGSHVLQLLRNLRMPLVTTLHTVLRQPSPDQHRVMQEIVTLSGRLIVMSQHSAQILNEVTGVPNDKIDLIPHGVPDLPFVEPHGYKERFGVKGKTVLLTFGLLSANKGIENVIQALPQILYRLGLALFDLEQPEKCLLRGDSWIFGPEADYERNGDVHDVVFPCGYTLAADGDTINLYYGAADCCIALAQGSVRSLLSWLDANGHTEDDRDRST